MKDQKFDVIVIGAGIVGLATAYSAATKGLKTLVIERNPKAIGASIRNFGLIWPIGQPAGDLFDRAMRTRETWINLSQQSDIHLKQNGSLQLAYHDDEVVVLEAFMDTAQSAGYKAQLISPEQAMAHSPAIKPDGLKSAIWSSTECTVSPRNAISQLADFLEKKMNVTFVFGSAVTHISTGFVSTFHEIWQGERIFVCSGSDFETLYPRIFRESGITKCKLQMLRTGTQPNDWDLGPSLCAGLTLLHYGAFKHIKAIEAVRNRYYEAQPDFNRYGVHVLVSQNQNGEVILGDSHEYGWNLSPFDKEEINQLILNYLNTFASFPSPSISETWHGIYPKLEGQTEFVREADPNVWIVNGLSGAGMTMSFGLAQELV